MVHGAMLKRFRDIFLLLAVIVFLPPLSTGYAAPLTITMSSEMPPLSIINNEGEPDGLLVEFWEKWAEKSDTEITFKLQSWRKTVEDTASQKNYIHGGLFYSAKRARNLLFGDYIFPMEGALFASSELANEDKIDMQQISCGIIRGGYGKEFMAREQTFTSLTIFDAISNLLKAVKEGRLSLFLMDYPVAMWQLEKMGLSDSFVCIKKLYKLNIYPAVSKKNPELIRKINLNMAAIPQKEKQAIINKWLYLPPKTNDYRTTALLLTGLVLILMVCFHRNEIRTMAKNIKKHFCSKLPGD